MTSTKFQLTLSFLEDVLRALSSTSKRMQASNAGIADVSEAMEDLTQRLQDMQQKDGRRLQATRQQQAIGRHQQVDRPERGGESFDEVKETVLSSLLKSLESKL